MIKRLFSLFIAAFITFNISVPICAAASEETFTEIDSYLQNELKKAHVPGMAIMIVDKNAVLFSNTYGNCNSIDTPFIIGSMSKSFTAIAVMQLAEKGKINLDENVSKYLPELSVGDKITVKQLLNQTSGLGTYQTRNNLKITDTHGTHLYANVNYGLLGEIIESVSEMNYEDYIEQNVYTPIGMNHSHTSLEGGKIGGLIPGYRNYFGFSIPQEVAFPDGEGWTSVSGGYLIASASDMGKYLQMYLNNGNDVVSTDSINTVFYDNVYNEPSGTYYGMGWNFNENYPESVLGHSGLVENYTSNMFILPERGIGVVMLVNMNDYFVSNSMMSTIGESVILSFMGQEMVEISKTGYMFSHLLINCIYFILFLTGALPLTLIKQWNKKIKNKELKIILITGGILHVIYPTLLLLLPTLVGVPFFVIRGFVPDLFFVLLVSAAISYVTGIIKAILLWKTHCRK